MAKGWDIRKTKSSRTWASKIGGEPVTGRANRDAGGCVKNSGPRWSQNGVKKESIVTLDTSEQKRDYPHKAG